MELNDFIKNLTLNFTLIHLVIWLLMLYEIFIIEKKTSYNCNSLVFD
jgi:hypothetical protein